MSALNPSAWGSAHRIGVVGAAATGLSVARVLSGRGVRVVVIERRPLEEISVGLRQAFAALRDVELRCSETELPDGIDALVPSPGVRRDAPPIRAGIDRGVPILSEIEIAWSIARVPLLGVTGTNGKTTTVAMLTGMVAASGRRAWQCGNIATDRGERLPLIEAAAQATGDAVLVAEISSFQLEWVQGFRPRGAAWLNLSEDHGDAYPDRETYARAKRRILEAQEPVDVAVLNQADPTVTRLAEGAGAARRLWFDGADPKLPVALAGDPATLPLYGRHQFANATAAALLAIDLGIDPAAVWSALENFRPVPHRMEVLGTHRGIHWINNSMCTNTAAVDASLSAISGRAVAIAGGRAKGADLADLVTVLRERSGAVVAIGEVAIELSERLQRAGHRVVRAQDMDDAVAQAASLAKVGDTVVLSPGCSSFDQFSGFEERGRVFREAVSRWAQE